MDIPGKMFVIKKKAKNVKKYSYFHKPTAHKWKKIPIGNCKCSDVI
jgi:hypothetical protein